MAVILKQKLGDILLQAGYITDKQLEECLAEQKTSGKRLGNILVEKGYVTEQSLIEVLEFQLGVPHVILSKRQIDPEVIKAVPEHIVKKYKVFPVEKRGNILTLGMLDPTDVFALDDIKILLGCDIQPVIITEGDLNKAIGQYYQIQSTMEEVYKDFNLEIQDEKEEEISAHELRAMVEDAPIVKLVNIIISQAVKDRASDIHVEPTEKEVVVRYRIDGHLRQVMTSPKNTQAAIISRIKIMSKMDIAEKRLPQDGRINMKVDNMAIDIRVSSIPTVFGEKIVMRLLFKSNVLAKIETLGFLPETLQLFRSVYSHPHGIILVTGPTGSGKSTTLSAVLNELNQPDVNIMTVEDPVEYQIPGVNQVQVNTKAGLTFASALRSFLRQDPDIIMVGEIRDNETARIATQAALTGHLVLSTLHTNDAPSSITRLIDMGIEPFLVASTVVGIIAQRLVRAVCKECKEAYEITENDPAHHIIRNMFPDLPEGPITGYHGKGCRACNNSGYAKRLAIHEVLVMNHELRGLTSKNVSADILKEAAIRSAGMNTLLKDGLIKALAGKTTVDEVIRAAYTGD
ncbi:MAG: GspE/PulE family protein [Bacillota bacterium]|jgi:type IV pilus assembly protein PilB